MAQLAQRLGFDLANALAGDLELLADFFERAARAIAEAEGITVRTEEVNNEYRRLSVQQDTPEADIRRVLTPETVAAALVAQKVQRFLLDNAVVASVMDADKE